MKKIALFLLIFLHFACAENLMDKPDGLIPKEKMVDIFNDIAMLNAAKTTDISVLIKHEIKAMDFIYEKYNIDSLQFVESDRYYASIPTEHEAIYIAVEAKLEAEKERVAAVKKITDSLKKMKNMAERKALKVKDSLLKIEDKKK